MATSQDAAVIDQNIGLIDKTWPNSTGIEQSQEKRRHEFQHKEPEKQCHIMFDQEKVIGYAETYERTVFAGELDLRLLALASVCVDEKYRGQEVGKNLIRFAFGRVRHLEFPVCLFQTNVPEFYKKYDCREVHNKFYDSKSLFPFNGLL